MEQVLSGLNGNQCWLVGMAGGLLTTHIDDFPPPAINNTVTLHLWLYYGLISVFHLNNLNFWPNV